jgi:hypothetical protein
VWLSGDEYLVSISISGGGGGWGGGGGGEGVGVARACIRAAARARLSTPQRTPEEPREDGPPRLLHALRL